MGFKLEHCLIPNLLRFVILLFAIMPYRSILEWNYVFIQDDPGMHFRRVIRNAEGQRRWRCRNSEPDAGKVLNTRLASDGLLRQ